MYYVLTIPHHGGENTWHSIKHCFWRLPWLFQFVCFSHIFHLILSHYNSSSCNFGRLIIWGLGVGFDGNEYKVQLLCWQAYSVTGIPKAKKCCQRITSQDTLLLSNNMHCLHITEFHEHLYQFTVYQLYILQWQFINVLDICFISKSSEKGFPHFVL